MSNFSQWYNFLLKLQGCENEGNDCKLKMPLIVRQILLVRTIVNVWRTVKRTCVLMLRYKG